MARMKTPKCSAPKCRKPAIRDGLCEKHTREVTTTTDGPVNPQDGVLKVDELEAARFAALDAELRNHLQSIRIIELEFGKAEQDMKEYVTKFQHEQTQRSGQRKYYQDLVTVKKAEYQDFVQSLGKKYGLDPTQMSIEPESRTIRDLRKDSPS